jgi:hypothetical protein
MKEDLFKCGSCHRFFADVSGTYRPNCKNKSCNGYYTRLIFKGCNPNFEQHNTEIKTFGKQNRHRIYEFEKLVEQYKDYPIMKLLAGEGFKIVDDRTTRLYSGTYMIFANKKGDVVLIEHYRGRVFQTLFTFTPDKTLIEKVKATGVIEKEYIKAQKNNPPPKPEFETIKDMFGNDCKVGDWVVYWASSQLNYGTIKSIEKDRYKGLSARVYALDNKQTSPLKSSRQLMLLHPEQATHVALMRL